MSKENPRTRAALIRENDELRHRLGETEQMLAAIRHGGVDAIVVSNPRGESIYTLTGAEHAYRVIVETMNEAALTAGPDGTILYCNQRFCDLMRTPMHEAMGRRVTEFVAAPQQAPLETVLADAQGAPVRRHLTLRAADGTAVPVLLSAGPLHAPDGADICLVASDLTELEESTSSIRVLREHRQALAEGEERYRRFFMEDLTGDFLATPDGRLIECNPAFAEIYGFDSSDAAQYDVSEFNPSGWLEVRRLIRERGKIQNYESWHERPDGLKIYIVANLVGTFNDKGELTAIKGYVFEDTARKVAMKALDEANLRLQARSEDAAAVNEQLLTQQEELQRQALELQEMKEAAEEAADEMEWLARISMEHPDPVLRIATDGTILYRNPAADVLCRSWRVDVGEEVPPGVKEIVSTAHARQDTIRREEVFTQRTWVLTAAPVPGTDYINLFAHDLTIRRKAEEALRESEARLKLAQKAAHIGVFDWDMIHDKSVWTEEFCAIFGLSPEDCDHPTEAWQRIISPEERARVEQEFYAAAAERRPEFVTEYRILRPGGAIGWVANMTAIAYNEAGEPIRMTGVALDITERKEAEIGLRIKDAAIASSLNAIAMADLEGRLTYVNPAFLRLWGYEDEREVLGRSVLEFWQEPPRAREVVQAIQNGQGWIGEMIATRKDGTSLILYLSASTVFDDAGAPLCTMASFMDITERDRIERELRESEARYRTLFESIDEGFCIIEVIFDGDDKAVDYRFLEVNPAFVRQTGMQDARGKRMRQFVPNHEAYWFEIYGRIALTGEPERFQNEAKGLHRWYDVYAFRVGAPESRRVAILFNDITERRQAEGALRESETRLRLALDAGRMGTWVWDLATDTVDTDALHRCLWDLDEADVRVPAGVILERIHPGDRALAFDSESAPDRLTGPQDMEFRVLHRDGSVRWFLGAAVPVRDADGVLRKVIGVNLDITERKEAERRIRATNTELEQRVAERTAELQHRAQQLQKMALELSQAEDRERKRMAEILHDDLQQQLAAVKFHVGILAGRVRGDIPLQKAANQIEAMLRDAVETSRGLSHELSPAIMYHGDLGEILEWLANQVRIKHGLIVRVDIRGQIDTSSDALKIFLYKAVQEMLFNAVKHARVSEARVRMRRRGGYLCLMVSDRGRGFDPQELRRAAGFGLMSIRERIALLGGRMKMHSAVGVGSRFIITVPDGHMAEKGAPAGSRGRQDADAAPTAASRLRVLIADDHEIVRQGLASLLAEAKDVEVVGEAGNGREAVDQAYDLQPDVVIMDVAMPLMNGDEASRQIRKHLPQTRIVALSMHEEPGTVEKMRRAGAESYILKTAPADELLAAVRGARQEGLETRT